MNINYDRIIQLFQNNIGPLSVKTPLNNFFVKLPLADRSQAEYFMRTELGADPINEMEEILPGQYWSSDGISELTIPPAIKKCAEGAFKGSDLHKVVIASPLDGNLNLDIFVGVPSLTDIIVDPSVADKFTKLTATTIMADRPGFVLSLPSALVDKLENGSVQLNANQAFGDYINDNHLDVI